MRDCLSVEYQKLLVDRCIARDDGAWRELCRSQRPHLVVVLRRLLRYNPVQLSRIEDIIADVWSSLCLNNYERLRRFDPNRAPLPVYLIAIALQKLCDLQRYEQRHAQERPQVMRGDEHLLARSSDRPIEFALQELLSLMPAGQAAFLRQMLGPEWRSGPVRSNSAARQMKHHALVTVTALVMDS